MLLFLLAAVLFLAYTNGANDNFKGVATLLGSRTTDYRRALTWATITTFAGSLTAIRVCQGLIQAFIGKGIVPAAVTSDPTFLFAVGFGAALTVLLATLIGLPISTTHALTGALIGAGCMAVGWKLHLEALGQTFLIPLAVSPLLSLAITVLVYPLFRVVREQLGVTKELCLCVGPAREPVFVQPNGALVSKSTGVEVSIGERGQCIEQYRGILLGLDCQRLVDQFHFLSAGMVCFARGLNDTPKIVALLVAAQALRLDGRLTLFLVALAMSVGGLLHSKKVAHTMSQKITQMNHGQGFTANLVTSSLVTLASRFGLPVSTTHVSCGALFGIGVVNHQAHGGVIRDILLSWVLTLPVAACLAAILYRIV